MANIGRNRKITSILRSLQHRNFRLFFGGQAVSLTGTWMQQVAMSWLVYRMTDSPFLLGVVGFSSQIPTLIFSPVAGVYADRFNRYHLLIATQTLAMVQAFVLAFLTLTGVVQVWHIIGLSLFIGFVYAVDIPVRQSFFIEMLDRKEDLGNAIALNSFLFNGARLVGPSIAGIMIAVTGEGICFLLNGISFFAIILALAAMRIPKKEITLRHVRLKEGLTEGYRYVRDFVPIRYILLQLALISFMGMPYAVLLPVFARDILLGGSHTLGFLMGASGLGALTGALYLASRKTVLGLGRWIALTSGLFGAGIIAFALSKVFLFSLVMMFVTGFGMMVQMASSNTIIQTIVDEDKRGRVMSFFAMSFMGMAPFGSLFAGSLASVIGAPGTLVITGACCMIGAAFFYRRLPEIRRHIRPVYRKMGILPQVPTA
ncbi:MAG TPA: MFS transporter [Syntrophales bacterium]|nr:MFS transporter [Syntrophales bacterium]